MPDEARPWYGTFDRLGCVTYVAYGDVVGWVNFQGDPMPGWNDLPPKIQAAWGVAARKARYPDA